MKEQILHSHSTDWLNAYLQCAVQDEDNSKLNRQQMTLNLETCLPNYFLHLTCTSHYIVLLIECKFIF